MHSLLRVPSLLRVIVIWVETLNLDLIGENFD